MSSRRISSEARAVVATVRVAVAFAPPGVTVGGEMVQVEAEGAPLHDNEIADEKPPAPGATVMVAVLPVDAPATNEMLAGATIVKSKTVTGIVTEVPALKMLEPAYVKPMACAPAPRFVRLSVATPLPESVPVPRIVLGVLSKKVTVPDGTPLVAVAVAVKVMELPANACAAVVVTVRVIAPLAMMTLIRTEVDGLWMVSPPYTAVIE
jgi:hypothetical protein